MSVKYTFLSCLKIDFSKELESSLPIETVVLF